jgi:hypothetical protein
MPQAFQYDVILNAYRKVNTKIHINIKTGDYKTVIYNIDSLLTPLFSLIHFWH